MLTSLPKSDKLSPFLEKLAKWRKENNCKPSSVHSEDINYCVFDLVLNQGRNAVPSNELGT